MNKRQKKKRNQLYDTGFASWKEKRRIAKGYRAFLKEVRHLKETKDWKF